VPSCYWLAWVGQVVRVKELVCSPGRLPQIIRIGKFHAWLLLIGGIFCVSSCYWLAWAGQVILVCSPGRLPQIIRIGKFHAWLLMLAGCNMCYLAIGWRGLDRWSRGRSMSAVWAGYHRLSKLVSFMHGCL
jgi:hypothetical protein